MPSTDEFNAEMLDLAHKAIDRTRPMRMTPGERGSLDIISKEIARLIRSLRTDTYSEKL